MSLVEELAHEIVKDAIQAGAEITSDFIYKATPKNAAIDQKNGMYDVSHVAVLGGEYD